jgi:hypothetical protein
LTLDDQPLSQDSQDSQPQQEGEQLNEIFSNNYIEFANDKSENPDDLRNDIFDVSSSENSIEEIDDTSGSKDDESSVSKTDENCNEEKSMF